MGNDLRIQAVVCLRKLCVAQERIGDLSPTCFPRTTIERSFLNFNAAWPSTQLAVYISLDLQNNAIKRSHY